MLHTLMLLTLKWLPFAILPLFISSVKSNRGYSGVFHGIGKPTDFRYESEFSSTIIFNSSELDLVIWKYIYHLKSYLTSG